MPALQVLNESKARAGILRAALIGYVTVNDALIWINVLQETGKSATVACTVTDIRCVLVPHILRADA